MTEDEAKTKWCPMVRWSGDNAAGFGNNRGRIDKDQHNAYCIGSQCMMWREHTEKILDPEPGVECGAAYVHGGYCRLSGKVD